MTLAAYGSLYATVGVGLLVAVLLRQGRSGRLSPLDCIFTVSLWPLYGPLLLTRDSGGAPASSSAPVGPFSREVAENLVSAFERASRSPLGTLLPDRASARALAERLEVAQSRVEEIEELERRPEFDEAAARRRLEELGRAQASAGALRSAERRLENIRDLSRLRDRFERELEEVAELLTQLTTQAELVRLAGSYDSSDEDLVEELVARIEGLGEMFGEQGLSDEHTVR